MVKITDIEWKFPFGKYKGITLRSVAGFNYSYCDWFSNNVEGFDLSPVMDRLRSIASTEDDSGPSSLQIDCEKNEAYF